MKRDPEHFYMKLRKLLNAHIPGGNQAELARRIGVSGAQVSRWLSGERMPTAIEFLAIAEEFRVDPFFLIGADRRAPVETAAVPTRGRPPLQKKDPRKEPAFGAHPVRRQG